MLAADVRSPDGERAAALNRGMAIIARAGLNPDHFDIPGRERPSVPVWDGTGRSPWLDGLDMAEFLGAGMPVFTMNDVVAAAFKLAEINRRKRAAEQAARRPPRADGRTSSCKHGPRPFGTGCEACKREAYEKVNPPPPLRCPHGVSSGFCGQCASGT